MAVILHHPDPSDWCHCCGCRDEPTADVWHPIPNAEHAEPADHKAGYGWPPDKIRYIRICRGCALAIADAATDPTVGRIIRAPRPRRWFKGWRP